MSDTPRAELLERIRRLRAEAETALREAAAELARLEQENAQLRAGYLAIERAAWARSYSRLKQAREAAGLTDMATRRDLEEGRQCDE